MLKKSSIQATLLFACLCFGIRNILISFSLCDSSGYETFSLFADIINNSSPTETESSSSEPLDLGVAESSLTKSHSLRPKCFDNGNPCKYDEVGTYLEQSAKFTMIHKPNDAIPAHRRIPAKQGGNASYIAQRRMEGAHDGSETPLVEYNPTFLPLTSDLDKKLLDYLTGRYHPDISDEEADKVKYLSVARGSNNHDCGNPMRRMGHGTKEQTYLVLALVDEDLQPIPKASAALRAMNVLLPSQCTKRKEIDVFQDFQIIAARTTKGNPKKDQLFMVSSDSRTYIFVIDIRRVPSPTNDVSGWDTKVKGTPVRMGSVSDQEDEKKSSHFYGQGLQLRFRDDQKPPGYCTTILLANILDANKNYHFFDVVAHQSEDDPVGIETSNTYDTKTVDTFMEIRPHGKRGNTTKQGTWNRGTRKVNFYAEQFHKYDDWELVPDNGANSEGLRNQEDIVHSHDFDQEDQWAHPKQNKSLWKGEDGGGRGTACCIDLQWGAYNNETVKVGISHGVSINRSYVSRFYAFETKTGNFSNVAISGPFCFGGMAEHDVNAETQIFPIPATQKLVIQNATYDCPKVTFASGLAHYQSDPNYAIISYGVNDCYSRSIIISKDRIRELLDLRSTSSDIVH